MTKSKIRPSERNWALVAVASIVILIGAAFLIVAVVYVRQLKWLSLGASLTGIGAISCAGTAIKHNDPTWLLLDLLFQ